VLIFATQLRSGRFFSNSNGPLITR